MSFTPNTTFYLIKDVDIDVSYTHQYYFSNETDQYNFFYGKVFKTVEGGTYQRKNSNTIALPFQADAIRQAKYLMWQNKNYSDKWYYAFVTLIDYVNPNVSNISYELDVYQTYLFDMNWKESFINRKHCDRWKGTTKTYPTINLEPENLDYGNAYQIVEQAEVKSNISGTSWVILGFTENMVDDEWADQNVQGIPTQLRYYILPMKTEPNGEYWSYTFKEDTTYLPLDNIGQFLNACGNDSALVGKLVSVYITPYLPINDVSYTTGENVTHITDSRFKRVTFKNTSDEHHVLMFANQYTKYFSSYQVTTDMSVYSNLEYDETKLMMYPYSFVEMTNQRGDSLVFHNEYINGGMGGRIEVDVFGTISYASSMIYTIRDYLLTGSVKTASTQPKVYGLTDRTNLNLPIIDDYSASYLQANNNSIRVARSNALATIETIEKNADASYSNALNVAANTRDVGLLSAPISALGSVGAGLAQQGVVGGIGGAISGLADTATGIMSTLNTYQNSVSSAGTTLANAYRSSMTDYENSIASINAKVQDAEQVASTSRSMGGDYFFNIINDTDKVMLLKKTILPEYAEKLTAYFNQYGYAYNRVEIPQFHTRTSWNYFKMLEPNVSGNIPMNDLLKIRDIFIKGITLWHGDYIGNYSRNNDEV